MAYKVARGTKEIIPVLVVDNSGIVTDLSGATPKFWLLRADGTTYVYNDVAANASGMRIDCLCDLSSTGPQAEIPAEESLKLWVGFTNGSEKPRLGPILVKVSDQAL